MIVPGYTDMAREIATIENRLDHEDDLAAQRAEDAEFFAMTLTMDEDPNELANDVIEQRIDGMGMQAVTEVPTDLEPVTDDVPESSESADDAEVASMDPADTAPVDYSGSNGMRLFGYVLIFCGAIAAAFAFRKRA